MTFAAEVKQTKTAAPVVKATTMSDSEMDKVTAGNASCSTCFITNNGRGINFINLNASPSLNAIQNGFQGPFHGNSPPAATGNP